LYYRLRVVPIQLPPLRERAEDIPLLAEHFIRKICKAEGLRLKRFSAQAMTLLMSQSWPGNVRELENSISMAVALSGEAETLEVWHFPSLMVPQEVQAPMSVMPPCGIDYDQAVTMFKRSLLEQALRSAQWNKAHAARMLGLKRTTLTATLKSLSLCQGDIADDELNELVATANC
jgi:DNA-binding NtrC family response regulator